MTEDNFDVVSSVKENLQVLKSQVGDAFRKRRIEHLIPEQGITQEMNEEYEKLHVLIDGKPDDMIIDLGEYQQVPWEVVVEHSHEYMELLKFAVQAVRPEWADDEVYVAAEASDMFKHEMDHAVPEIGHDESNVLYGVHFFQDEETREVNIFPFVKFEGKTTVG